VEVAESPLFRRLVLLLLESDSCGASVGGEASAAAVWQMKGLSAKLKKKKKIEEGGLKRNEPQRAWVWG